MSATVVITGAFSYTGKYATRLSWAVDTRSARSPTILRQTIRSGLDPFGDRVAVSPYNFDRPDELRRSLEGASILINTYWVRFPRGELNFETAVRNSRTFIKAAKDAGVRRIVHVSIANPSLESPLGYYKGKARGRAGGDGLRPRVCDLAADRHLRRGRHPHQQYCVVRAASSRVRDPGRRALRDSSNLRRGHGAVAGRRRGAAGEFGDRCGWARDFQLSRNWCD